MPAKAVKREVGEDNRDCIKVGVVMAGNDAELNSQCAECEEGGASWA